MIRPSTIQTLCAAAVLATLAGCGGGGGSSALAPANSNPEASTPDIAQANGSAEPIGSDTAITGRVADGYLQGATVCIDVNENKACDSNEPSAISAEGGVYELQASAGHRNSPILAEVPETAIDEDTQQPVGKRIVLSAPAERPQFVSPITTLVQQELEDNPAFDIDAAEDSIKQELGLNGDGDAGLFEDYVSNGRDENSERPEQFRYLHQTAQIVARMMQEIQQEAEEAISAEGIDVEADPQARRALQKLLRDQVRELLPEITHTVAESVASESASDQDDSADATEKFNPLALAEQIRPQNGALDAERIQAEIERRPPIRASVEDMLKNGFYIIDVDCDYHHEYAEDEPSSVEIDRDALECAAEYSHLTLSDSGDKIVQTGFAFDPVSTRWIQYEDETFESEELEPPHSFRLNNGEWQAEGNEDNQTSVEFSADGGAIISHSDGRMEIRASEQDLSSRSLFHHLRELGTDRESATEIADDAVFADDSSAYIFHLRRVDSQYVLFNWYADAEDDSCARFNDNCNVVQQLQDDEVEPVASLEHLMSASADGVTLTGLVHDADGQPVDATFTEQDSSNGRASNSGGQVTWQLAQPVREPDIDGPGYEPDTEICIGPIKVSSDLLQALPRPDLEATDFLPDHNNLDLLNDDAIDELGRKPDEIHCADPVDYPQLHSELANDDVESSAYEISRRPYGRSRWRMIEVQGVKMIELEVPVQLRHRIDMDNEGSILLIEHNGFVRRGGHFDQRGSERETGYNEAAFRTMQNAAQAFMGY